MTTFASPTSQSLVDGAWIATTGVAPLSTNEADFFTTVNAAITAEGGTPGPTAPADFNVAYALSSNTTFQTNVSKIAGFGTNATQFIQALSQSISGSQITISAELNGFVQWLNATPAVGTAANGNGWAGIAAIYIESLLGTIPTAELQGAGLTADQITYFTNQHISALNRAVVGQTFALDQQTLTSLSGDSYNSLILSGVDQTSTSLNNALTQLSTAVSTNNPAAVTGQAQIITLTPGIDTISTPSPNVTFFAPDVLVAGTLVPTLNPGDSLTDTAATSTATLSILTSASFTTIHDFSGFTTSGIPNLLIQNNDPFGMALSGSGMTGLTTITSQNAALFADTFLTGIQNKVALDVTGSVAELTLSYANPITGAQALVLNGAVSQPGTAIDFLGANAPASLAVSLTGNSIVNIFDAALTTITATSTDTGATNTLRFFDGGDHSITSANFSAVTGALTAFFGDDNLANGAAITLGASDTLHIGNNDTAAFGTNLVTVTGNGGLYNVALGNQLDTINLGAHGTADTLTFVQPWFPQAGTGPAPDIITGSNFVTDTYNFSVGGFNGGSNAAGGAATQLLTLGSPVAVGNNLPATLTAAGTTGNALLYTGVILQASGGQNLIEDTHDTSLAGINATLNGAATRVGISNGVNPGGAILVAYQATDGVHIAEDIVAAGATTTAGATAHDIIDLVGTNLANFNASHFHFVA